VATSIPNLRLRSLFNSSQEWPEVRILLSNFSFVDLPFPISPSSRSRNSTLAFISRHQKSSSASRGPINYTPLPPFISTYANFNRIKTKDKPLKSNTSNSALGNSLQYGPSASNGIMASVYNQAFQSTSNSSWSWNNIAVYSLGNSQS
jgi:hypothetical protein